MEKIIIGSRGSPMALKQTDTIRKKLLQIDPDLQIDVKIIIPKGDRDKKSPIPLDTIGKGWFSKEIDQSLLKGEIDAAVHSLKDVSEVLPSGLLMAALPKREDAREALIAKNNLSLAALHEGAIIGTDSSRRKSQILNKR